MVHKSIRLVHAVILVFSALLAFLLVKHMDEATPLEADASVTVTGWDRHQSAAEARKAIKGFAEERGITVAQLFPDLVDHRSRRHLYLVNGDPTVPGGAWLKDGYPDFSRSVTTEVHPFDELSDRAPMGRYVVFGGSDKAEELASFLHNEGMTANAVPRWSVRTLDDGYGDSAFQDAWLMMGLVVITLTGAGVLLNTRAYGVSRLQGLSGVRILARDLRQVAPFSGLTAAAVSVTVVIGLALFNGLAGLTQYTLTALVLAGFLTAAAVAAHAAALALTFRVALLAAVKGELPGKTASVAVYAVRVPVLGLVVMLAAQAMTAGADLADRERSYEAYRKLGQTSVITEGNNFSDEDRDTSERVIGTWLREEDHAGQVILASRNALDRSVTGGAERELLIVNEAFLDAQPVLDAEGRRYTADRAVREAEGQPVVRILVPESLADKQNAVVRTVADLPITRDQPEQGRSARKTRFEPAVAAGGQRIFAYSPDAEGPVVPGSWQLDESFAQDPVIAVFPSRHGLLSDLSYTAYATQGAVLFRDPGRVGRARAASPELARHVVAVTPVAEEVAAEMSTLLGEFRLTVFSAVAGAAVLVITGLGVCTIHARRNAQAVFARHVSGWRFTATHRVLLGIEAAVVVALLGWGPYKVWRDNQDLEVFAQMRIPAPYPPAEMTGADWASAISLAALCAGSVIWSLALFHRRIVREGASES